MHDSEANRNKQDWHERFSEKLPESTFDQYASLGAHSEDVLTETSELAV